MDLQNMVFFNPGFGYLEGMAEKESSELGITKASSMQERIENSRKRKLETSEEPQPRWGSLRSCGLALGFDVDWCSYEVIKSTWQYDYEIALFARIGLHCHNFQNGTNYKFKRLEKCGTHSTRYEDYYITFEATDPTSSVFSFQTMLSNDYQNRTWGIGLTLASLAARIKATHGTESVEEVWDRDSVVPDIYKGPMPKWFSDEALARDDKKFYVVQESELHENDWLQLLMEVAFYSKTESGVSANKPLEIKKVVVETLEEYTIEAREKLKADNAIFYINYKCNADPSTHWAGEHDAIIRKTMDGKPGHMSLEVAFTKEQIVDRET